MGRSLFAPWEKGDLYEPVDSCVRLDVSDNCRSGSAGCKPVRPLPGNLDSSPGRHHRDLQCAPGQATGRASSLTGPHACRGAGSAFHRCRRERCSRPQRRDGSSPADRARAAPAVTDPAPLRRRPRQRHRASPSVAARRTSRRHQHSHPPDGWALDREQ